MIENKYLNEYKKCTRNIKIINFFKHFLSILVLLQLPLFICVVSNLNSPGIPLLFLGVQVGLIIVVCCNNLDRFNHDIEKNRSRISDYIEDGKITKCEFLPNEICLYNSNKCLACEKFKKATKKIQKNRNSSEFKRLIKLAKQYEDNSKGE